MSKKIIKKIIAINLVLFILFSILYLPDLSAYEAYGIEADEITQEDLENLVIIREEELFEIDYGWGGYSTDRYDRYYEPFYFNKWTFEARILDHSHQIEKEFLQTGYYRIHFNVWNRPNEWEGYNQNFSFIFYYDAEEDEMSYVYVTHASGSYYSMSVSGGRYRFDIPWDESYREVEADWTYLNRESRPTLSFYKLHVNVAPNIHLLSSDIVAATEPELSQFDIQGFVQDDNDQTLTLKAVLTRDHDELVISEKTQRISNTAVAKEFSIPYDILNEKINQGEYTLTITVSDGYITIEKKIKVTVKARVKNGAYVLVHQPVYYTTLYQDPEEDRKHQEQYKFTHDPAYFDNSMGKMEESGVWKPTGYDRFPKTGLVQGVYRAQDNPKTDPNFAEFRRWSKESLGMIEFKVHRKPIADFQIGVNRTLVKNIYHYNFVVSDLSYDLDHQSEEGRGISEWEWQWRKRGEGETAWKNGFPNNGTITGDFTHGGTTYYDWDRYEIRLRVRDIDGENGLGVWSDWVMKEVQPRYDYDRPIALFDIIPRKTSHTKNITVIDQSYAPEGYTLIEWNWRLTDENHNTIATYNKIPTSSQLKQNGLGKYKLRLGVVARRNGSSSTTSSLYYEVPYEVVNYPPIAAFTIPESVYRDTLIKPVNTSSDPDGEPITYKWSFILNGTEYPISSTSQNPSFNIQQIMEQRGILPREAISDNWMLKLVVTDTLGESSSATQAFKVVNQIPVAAINGPTAVKQYTNHSFKSAATDPDPADNPLSVYRWKLIGPDGSIQEWSQKDVQASFDLAGEYTLEHWTYDQIGEMSNVARKVITVAENRPPTMTIINPSGSLTNPTVVIGNPVIEWRYSDPEDDLQEKYSFDFYLANNDLLLHSMQADDTRGGNTRSHSMGPGVFERSVIYKILGRSYSRFQWSQRSNEVYFLINTPPEVEVTNPSSTDPKAPTIFNDLQPTFEWYYFDQEGHGQKRFRTYVKNNGQLIIDSGVINSPADHWTSPIELDEETVYSLEVEVFDGYEWSQMSEKKYFQVMTHQIIDITDSVGGKRGEKLKVRVVTTAGAEAVMIDLPSSFQRKIKLNEKDYIFGNPSPYATLVSESDVEKVWEYDFILPWTQTSPADGQYIIEVQARFIGDIILDGEFQCVVNDHLRYFNPAGTY